MEHPRGLVIDTTGKISGRTGAYEKHLGDLAGVYQDAEAFQTAILQQGSDTVVYRVEESRVGTGPGALIFGTSTVFPGRVGAEYALTKGHLHHQADREEIYYCISGRGVMLMDSLDGASDVIELTPNVAVHVPGRWIHRSVNVGNEPLVTLFVYNEDAGQDYDIITAAGGMRQLVVDDGSGGWRTTPNPNHIPYKAVEL